MTGKPFELRRYDHPIPLVDGDREPFTFSRTGPDTPTPESQVTLKLLSVQTTQGDMLVWPEDPQVEWPDKSEGEA